MTDTSCGCTTLHPCSSRATQEDLLCDDCRDWRAPAEGGRIHMARADHDGAHRTLRTATPISLSLSYGSLHDDD